MLARYQLSGYRWVMDTPAAESSSVNWRLEITNSIEVSLKGVTMEPATKGLIIALFYGIVSASMAFANKAVLTSFNFDYPYFLVTCQMLLAIVILELLRLTQKTSLQMFTLERGKSFLLPSIFYAVHSVLSLSALSGMNIPMYGVIKRCNPVVILILGSVVLKKGLPDPLVVISVSLITAGCIVAGKKSTRSNYWCVVSLEIILKWHTIYVESCNFL